MERGTELTMRSTNSERLRLRRQEIELSRFVHRRGVAPNVYMQPGTTNYQHRPRKPALTDDLIYPNNRTTLWIVIPNGGLTKCEQVTHTLDIRISNSREHRCTPWDCPCRTDSDMDPSIL